MISELLWGLVPAAVICVSVLVARKREIDIGLGHAVLRVLVFWAAVASFGVEILSIFSALTPTLARALWLVALVTSVIFVARVRKAGETPSEEFEPGAPIRWSDVALTTVVSIVLLTTLLVAWLAPPQTWDSLVYRMPRIAHWAQQGSLEHFATGIGQQNSRPPGAEYLMLHSFLLVRGDRLTTLLLWTSMAASLLAVSVIARKLGAGIRGQLLAAAFAATIPMGIVQASSTMNDYLVALWVVAALLEAIHIHQRGVGAGSALSLSGAIALGVLTKPTAVPFLAPIAVWAGWSAYRKAGPRRLAGLVLYSVVAVTVLNAGWLYRNLQTFGSPLNPAEFSVHGDMPRTPVVLVSNMIRNATLHMGTPSPHVNKAIAVAVLEVHDLLGLVADDPRTTSAGDFAVRPPTTHEDWVGNPLHFIVILATGAVVAAGSRQRRRPALPVVVVGACAVILFSLAFKWQIFGSRYHLPIFIMMSGVVGVVFERWPNRHSSAILGLVLFVASLPWLIGINSRPLISDPQDDYVESILVEPRGRLYFANSTYYWAPFTSIAAQISESGCRQIGIRLQGNDPEYLFWQLMGAPWSGAQLGWIVSGTPSEHLVQEDFGPCALICSECPSSEIEWRDHPRVLTRAGFSLYLAEAE